MKISTKMVSVFVLILVAAWLLLINGCGYYKEASKDEGCPAGTSMANSTDIITAPGDVTQTWASPFPGGPVYFSPLIFTVTASDGTPKNKVCVTFYTTGSWWTDGSFTTQIIGSGPLNRIVTETDSTGRVAIYWDAFLPISNPVISTVTGTTVTCKNGTDQKFTDWINGVSGEHSATFNYNWTVQGDQCP